MIKYFEKQIEPDRLRFYYDFDFDNNGNQITYNDRMAFYKEENGDDVIVFHYYGCSDEYEDKCPMVSLEIDYISKFNGYFGNLWIEPFKGWISKKIGKEVKYIE